MARNLEWRCLTCGITAPPTAEDYPSILNHPCDNRKIRLVDVDTGEVLASNIPQAQRKGLISGKNKGKPKGKKSPIDVNGNESGAAIKEHAKGFVEPEDGTLFIYYKGGQIERFWDRFGDHESIYHAMVNDGQFEGNPAEFVAASARYMLAVAGYEPTPCIIPKTQRQSYDETARLIREGVLKVYYDQEGKMKLGLNEEKVKEVLNVGDTPAKSGVPAGGDQHQPEGLSAEDGEEKPGKSQ